MIIFIIGMTLCLQLGVAMSKSSSSFNSLLTKAQSDCLNFEDVLSEEALKLVTAHADAIGVPIEFILWPLLTAVASFIGTKGHIEVNKEWLEPAIIWFVIAARKGEKKTAALRRIRKPIEKMEVKLRDKWESTSDEKKSSYPPQLIIDHFSFEELHTVMSRNECKLLGMFDELSCFYGQLDLYKHSSTVDRKTLLTLNGGGSWGRNFKSYSGHMKSTALNITGFIQPSYVYDMLTKSPDADGLNDRQLFDFPPEREVLLDELKVPMPQDIPKLEEIFYEIMEQHRSHRLYILQGPSYAAFQKIHDDLVRQKLKWQDENAQGILSKARGYVARIAMIIHSLEQALQRVMYGFVAEEAWDTSISTSAVEAAGLIVDHFNRQKFIMLGLDQDSTDDLPRKVIKVLSMETKNGDGHILPSDLSQKHISERVGPSYPTSKAVELIEKVVDLGYGTIKEYQTPSKRPIKRFVKHPLSDLTNNCKEALKKACITDDIYNRAFKEKASD